MKTQGLKDLEARIARLFAEHLEVELPTPEADLFESGLLDSWRLVVLLGALEAEFGVRVAMEELEFDDVRTLAQIVELGRSEAHTSELQSQSELVCRLLLEKKK